nr:zinc finger, CCHC-type, retrotransposon Gag domain protein [Tanacetum cinerariifolium]
MEKIFDVMGCEDAFKTRLAVDKFEGDALAWWKAYKQAKSGDERLKREYHSIRQMDTETSTEFMQRFLRLAGFLGAAAGTAEELPMLLATMRSSMRGMMMTLSDQTRGRRVVIGISRPLNRVVTGTTVIIMTVMDQTGKAVVTTHAATTTTLATTGVPVMGVTREAGVSSPTDLSILVSSSPGVPLRAIPTRSALRVDADTQESVVELLADKKPGASIRVYAITEDHATKTS